MNRLDIFILAGIWLIGSIPLGATDYTGLGAKIDTLIQQTGVRPFNGVILITQGGKTLYAREQGFSDFQSRTPIKLSDTFRIQSNSKQITAALVLRQVERGTIDLEAPIARYLPDLAQDWATDVTVHHLLNMTSGIAQIDDGLLFAPGTDFHYSNPGYGLLGKILTAVTGRSFSDLADQLFAELGMHQTSTYRFGGESIVIMGYTDSGDGIRPVEFSTIGFTPESWEMFAPAGGIVSTAADLLIWDTKLHSGRVLSDTMYKRLTHYSITAAHAAFGAQKIGYGYGVRIDDVSAKKHIGHAGRGIGFANLKFYVPEEDLSVIILENVYIYSGTRNAAVIYHFEREIRNLVVGYLPSTPPPKTHPINTVCGGKECQTQSVAEPFYKLPLPFLHCLQ